MHRGETFHHWEHVHCPKKKGGRVYIAVGHGGDVAVHEGYISQKETRRLEQGDVLEKPIRPELGAPLASYVDLHRHAAMRAKVATAPTIALRLMLAHTISGSSLWRVDVVSQSGATDAISESVETYASETAFDSKRRIALDLLGLYPDTTTVTGYGYDRDINALFARLLPGWRVARTPHRARTQRSAQNGGTADDRTGPDSHLAWAGVGKRQRDSPDELIVRPYSFTFAGIALSQRRSSALGSSRADPHIGETITQR